MTEPKEPADLQSLGRVHFLGMAGVGVSAIARLMLAAGVPISGTDAQEFPVLEEFRAAGVPVRIGYRAENIASIEAEAGEPISTVVASSVAKAGTNPEFDAAVASGKSMLHRSQGLAACMAELRGIAAAGTHGKTTTSSMTATLLDSAGLDPSFAIGATVSGFDTNARRGEGEWFVLEADESDGTLVNYSPEIAIITNIEADHLDHYGTAEAVDDVFAVFASRIRDGGTLVACVDDPGVQRLLATVNGTLAARRVRILTYGTTPQAQLRVSQIAAVGTGLSAVLSWQDEDPVLLELQVPGQHNALNATAAVGTGIAAGLSLSAAAGALTGFRGSSRRFESKGEAGGVRVFDDYAHHPTEVAAVLAAARGAADGGRVLAIFQPHLFSRTQAFAAEFGEALTAADTALVLEIYPAREQPIEGVSSELLGHPVRRRESAVQEIAEAARPGDLVLTLGAGDITHLGPEILVALQERSA